LLDYSLNKKRGVQFRLDRAKIAAYDFGVGILFGWGFLASKLSSALGKYRIR
jgi:hypothetical protein